MLNGLIHFSIDNNAAELIASKARVIALLDDDVMPQTKTNLATLLMKFAADSDAAELIASKDRVIDLVYNPAVFPNDRALLAIRLIEFNADDAARIAIISNPNVVDFLINNTVTSKYRVALAIRFIVFALDDAARAATAYNPSVINLLDAHDLIPQTKADLANKILGISGLSKETYLNVTGKVYGSILYSDMDRTLKRRIASKIIVNTSLTEAGKGAARAWLLANPPAPGI